jgi:hypothetical protein
LKEGQLRVEHGAAAANSAVRGSLASPAGSETGAADDVAPRKADGSPQTRALGAAEPKQNWTKRVAAGDFDGVLAEAQESGLDVVLGRSPLPDLVALADAARYRARGDVARRALLAQRERFPTSGKARTAAFLLGRLAETEPETAIGWYDRYLGEAPNGEFASEALGRKLVAVQSVSGPQAARPIAKEYLRRFPRGGYATKARELAAQ